MVWEWDRKNDENPEQDEERKVCVCCDALGPLKCNDKTKGRMPFHLPPRGYPGPPPKYSPVALTALHTHPLAEATLFLGSHRLHDVGTCSAGEALCPGEHLLAQLCCSSGGWRGLRKRLVFCRLATSVAGAASPIWFLTSGGCGNLLTCIPRPAWYRLGAREREGARVPYVLLSIYASI